MQNLSADITAADIKKEISNGERSKDEELNSVYHACYNGLARLFLIYHVRLTLSI